MAEYSTVFIYHISFIYFFSEDFVYLFLERGEGREKERERNTIVWLSLVCPVLGTWPTTQACALTRIRTSDPLAHRPALIPPTHTSQGRVWVYKDSLSPN